MSLFRSIWTKPTKQEGVVEPLNRFEALDLLHKVTALMSQDKYGEAMQTIGMDDTAFPEGQTLDEIFGAFQVRVCDLARQAGVKIGDEK